MDWLALFTSARLGLGAFLVSPGFGGLAALGAAVVAYQEIKLKANKDRDAAIEAARGNADAQRDADEREADAQRVADERETLVASLPDGWTIR